MKINVVKGLSILSTIAGIVTTVISSVSQEKMIKEAAEKAVKEALKNQK